VTMTYEQNNKIGALTEDMGRRVYAQGEQRF